MLQKMAEQFADAIAQGLKPLFYDAFLLPFDRLRAGFESVP
jgi:hypothetical protein